MHRPVPLAHSTRTQKDFSVCRLKTLDAATPRTQQPLTIEREDGKFRSYIMPKISRAESENEICISRPRCVLLLATNLVPETQAPTKPMAQGEFGLWMAR